MIFDLAPNLGLLPLTLGMSHAEVSAALNDAGKADIRRQAGEAAFLYCDSTVLCVFRANRAVEISVSPYNVVNFDGVDLFDGGEAWRLLIVHEPAPQETLGCVIMKSLGVTFTGIHDGDWSQRSVSVFEAGRWDGLNLPIKPFLQ
jgi:hypothetical protein